MVEQHWDALDFSYFFITDAPLSKDDEAAFKQRLFLAPKRSLKSLDDVLNFHLPHSDLKMRIPFWNYRTDLFCTLFKLMTVKKNQNLLFRCWNSPLVSEVAASNFEVMHICCCTHYWPIRKNSGEISWRWPLSNELNMRVSE